MDWWLFTFFLGAILSLFLPIVPALFQLFLLLLIAIVLYYFKISRFTSGLFFGACWILAFAGGYFYQIELSDLSRQVADAIKNRQAIVVKGNVVSLQANQYRHLPALDNIAATTSVKNTKVKFNFEITDINDQVLNTPILARLNWNKPLFNVHQGQVLKLNVKLKPAHGLRNVGAFSYKRWLISKDIAFTGYVSNKVHKPKADSASEQTQQKRLLNTHHTTQFIQQSKKEHSQYANEVLVHKPSLRQQLFNHYQGMLNALNDETTFQFAPLLLALTFGERSTLTTEQWQTLQQSGIGHLIAISGLHIGLVASASYFIFLLFFRSVVVLPVNIQTINARYVAIIFSLLCALFYCFLAGFSIPTMRALVMLSMYWLFRLLGLKVTAKRIILLTIFIIILLEPLSVLTMSFWLSLYAVTCLFIITWRFKYYLISGNYLIRFLKGLVVVQLSLTLLLLPITALFFQQVSLVAIAANLIAIPWMSVISIPLALFSIIALPFSEWLAQSLMSIQLSTTAMLWSIIEGLVSYSWSVLVISSSQLYWLLLLYLVSVILLIFPNVGKFLNYYLFQHFNILSQLSSFSRLRALSLTFFAAFILLGGQLSLSASKQKINDNFATRQAWQLVVQDVGQGLSLLLIKEKNALLYDTGASYPSGFNMADSVTLPVLKNKGISALDWVVLSHSDNYHAGSFSQLSSQIKINNLLTNVSLTTTDIQRQPCVQGNHFIWQGLTVTSLWPSKEWLSEQKAAKKQKNNDSCVLLISDGYHKLLLTADISTKIEHELLRLYPRLDADVLVVPHHGSKTSSSKKFIKQLAPEFALISAGYLNRWSMPVPEVLKKYHLFKTTVVNTADVGAIVVNFKGEQLHLESYRDSLRPFWFLN
ncbi:DNA internalization-related competence protein ComEC/Rec2 [Colwellia sp. RSH04]|uniref:DNA internalization-related competence protein ComEC/Rec2 n=1 Tax=Colwellia sp. RSH04 TaxID=2305464 RepID=UPI0015FC9618|nr:DNA internalization-related competence protein ComEC/Rec2 [Colwellia sp. RSH04]